MTPWFWLGMALAATGVGQVLFKAHAMTRRTSLLAATVLSFCMAPPASYLALRGLPLSTVYVSTALTQLGVVLLSMLLFEERYVPVQWLGLGLILAGVVVFNS